MANVIRASVRLNPLSLFWFLLAFDLLFMMALKRVVLLNVFIWIVGLVCFAHLAIGIFVYVE